MRTNASGIPAGKTRSRIMVSGRIEWIEFAAVSMPSVKVATRCYSPSIDETGTDTPIPSARLSTSWTISSSMLAAQVLGRP